MKIKYLRLQRGYTQSAVADKVHIARNTLSQFENNQGRPSYEVLVNLALLYEVSIDYLLGLTDDETPYWAEENNNEH